MFAAIAQTLEIGVAVEQETLQEKRGVNPGPIELGDEQAQFEIPYRNSQAAACHRLGGRIF